MLVLNPDAYRHVLRPLLFKLPPESAQRAAEYALRLKPLWRAAASALQVRSERLHTNLCGIKLSSPIGLAAGYDKNCEFLPSLAALGFGYLVCGTVTESPRKGNPRPRMARYVNQESLVNSLGFPSKGLEYAAIRIERTRNTPGHPPTVASVSGVTVDEIVRCHGRLDPLADAVEVNISSPNTEGLKVFHEPKSLAGLLGRINEQRRGRLFVKIPPYLFTRVPDLPAPAVGDHDGEGEPSQDELRRNVFDLVKVCLDLGVDAITVSNSLPVSDSRLGTGRGGLSGRALFPNMVRMVAEIRAGVGDKLAINACGGIFSAEDAWRALREGATTVQIFTGLIYRGPGIVGQIHRGLLRLMDREGVEALQTISIPLPPSR